MFPPLVLSMFPLLILNEPATVPNAPALFILSVPALSVVPPVQLLDADKVKVPLPAFINLPDLKLPLEAVKVRLLVVTSIVLVNPVVSEKALLVVTDAPVYSNVAAPITRFVASTAEAPKLLAAPPFAMLEALKVPDVMLVTPIYVFKPVSVQVPVPFLVKPPLVVAITPLCVALPVPVKTKLNAAPVTPPLKVKAPLPEASIIAPVPVKFITLSEVCPAPVYCNVVPDAIAIVPLPTVVGAPKALAPPLTLCMEFTLNTPPLIVVVPV